MADSLFRLNKGLSLNPQNSIPTNPTNGDIYYDSAFKTFVFYNDGKWVNLASKTNIASATSLTSAQFTAPIVQSSFIAITGTNTSNLHGLTAASDGKEVIIYNGSTSTLIINHNSGTEPTSGGKILTHSQGNITILADQTVLLVYNSAIFSGAGGYILASSPGSGGSGLSAFPADGFLELIFDTFDATPTSADSTINTTLTTATFDLSKQLLQLACDKTKTITTVGTAYTVSAAPTFVMKIGDVIHHTPTNTWRRVASITTTTTGTLDTAFSPDLTSASVMISQSVWIQELMKIGDAAQETRIADLYSPVNIDVIHVDYDDSLVIGDDVADSKQVARIVVSASNEGLVASTAIPLSSTFTQYFARPQAPAELPDYGVGSNPTRERCHLVFFCNPSNASVTTQANLLKYEASIIADAETISGGILNSAYAISDASSPAINSLQPTVVGGVTEWELGFDYVPQVHTGQTEGDLEIYVDGKHLPRKVVGSTLQSYWEEVPGSSRKIRFWTDLTSYAFDLQALKKQGITDTSVSNSAKLAVLYDAIVGSAAQVSSGIATYTSIQVAHDASIDGARILVLPGTFTENVTISKQIILEGKGRPSLIQGTLTLTASGAIIEKLKWGGNMSLGGTMNFVERCWIANGFTLSVPGTFNEYTVISE